jgi:hypothetical protein
MATETNLLSLSQPTSRLPHAVREHLMAQTAA